MSNINIEELLNEASNILEESTGSNGLRRRIEIERGNTKALEADKKLRELEERRAKYSEDLKDSKKARHAKHVIRELDKNITSERSIKNDNIRKAVFSKKQLEDKGKKSKEAIDKYGKDAALRKFRYKTEVDRGVADSYMKNAEKAQNESIAVLLTEAALLLND